MGTVHRRSVETLERAPVTRQQLSRFCITAKNFVLSALCRATSLFNYTFARYKKFIIVSGSISIKNASSTSYNTIGCNMKYMINYQNI